MTEETKKALEAYLLQLVEASKQGAAWAKDQVPLVLQEKLVFDAWTCIVHLVSGGLLIVAVWWLRTRVIKATKGLGAHDPFPEQVGYWLSLIGASFITVVSYGVYIYPCVILLLKIKYAPRVYLLEWALALAKGGGS
jgi:hypothetical protein